MNDPIEARLRQLVHELHDASPAAHPWEQVGLSPTPPRSSGPRWLVAAAAVLVVAIATVGIVTLATSDRHRTTIHGTNTDAATSAPPTTPAQAPTTAATSTVSSSPATTGSVVPATTTSTVEPTTAAPSGGQLTPIAVSYQSPPPELSLQPLALVDLAAALSASDSLPPVAALDGGRAAIVDATGHRIVVIEPSGNETVVPLTLEAAPFLVLGGHDVVYGIVQHPTPQDQAGAQAVAIALTGPNAGAAVATEPVDINPYVEVAPTILGRGKDSVINRRTGESVIGFTDTTGGPRASDTAPPNYRLDDDGTVRVSDGAAMWRLSIERAPGYSAPYVNDPAPAQIGDGRAVYWTSIGAPADPSRDLPSPTMPVIAVLEADGTGAWYRLPDGWEVVASDDEGVVFAQRVGGSLQLATLAPRPGTAGAVSWTDLSTTSIDVPAGSLAITPNDIIAVHDDGDLYLHPGLLAGPPSPPMRLVDEGDPRIPVTEGDGPNQVSAVAGERAGVLYYGDCCEPLAGNVHAAVAVDSNVLFVGYGASPTLSPDGRYLATASNFGMSIIDLDTGTVIGRSRASSSATVWEVEWSADQQTVVTLEIDDTGFSLVSYDTSTLSEIHRAPIGIPVGAATAYDTHFAGRGPDGEIAIAIRTASSTDIHFYAPDTLDPLAGEQRSAPATATSVRLGSDGRSLLWVVDGGLWYLPPDGQTARRLATHITAAWFGN